MPLAGEEGLPFDTKVSKPPWAARDRSWQVHLMLEMYLAWAFLASLVTIATRAEGQTPTNMS